MARRDVFGNLLLFAGVAVCLFLFLDIIVMKTEILEGISLREFLADEWRIRVLKAPCPAPGWDCRENDTSLIPGCRADYFPGFNVRIPGSKISINSFGIRDREYSLEKPPAAYRIFVVGDSFTFGSGVSNEEVYTERLEEELNARHNLTSFEVFNLGVVGTGTDSQYCRLLHYVDYSPDMVILQTHYTDVFDCKEMLEEIKGAYGEKYGTDKVFALESPSDYSFVKGYLNNITEEERCSCVRRYGNLIVNFTSSRGIPLIVFDADRPENDSCFRSLVHDQKFYFPAPDLPRKYRISRRDFHYNREGHKVIAEMLLPILLGAINETRPAMLE